MAHNDLDADIHKNRLLQEIDAAITEANRVKIMATAGAITQEQMLRVAVAGSGLRANYLHEILALGDKGGKLDENPGAMAKLKDLRVAYEEGVAAFDHLRHAMDCGYIDFDEG